MGSAILICIFFILILASMLSKHFRREHYYKIKYDLNNKMILKVSSLSATALWLIAIIISIIKSLMSDTDGEFGLYLFVIYFIIPLLILWVLYIDSCLYIKKLEYMGFVVPERKNDYNNDLTWLPRDESKINIPLQDKGMIILRNSSILFAILFFIESIFYYFLWNVIGDEIYFGVGCIWVISGIFIALSSYLNKNSKNNDYTDFEYFEPAKKIRVNFSDWGVGLIIGAIILALISTFSFSMTEYIMKSKESHDYCYLKDTLQYFSHNDKINVGGYSESEYFNPDEFDDIDNITMEDLVARSEYIKHFKGMDVHIDAWYSNNEIHTKITYKWKYGKYKEAEFKAEIIND